MSSFVIFAAGRGTRVGRAGDHLHKALLPLSGKAVISHIFDLAPADAQLVVCTGYRGRQIEQYVKFAHPHKNVKFVEVPNYDSPGSGPGASLSRAKDLVGEDDFFFTSCDTLWSRDLRLWQNRDISWSAIAAVPAGTSLDAWCRMRADRSHLTVDEILDKELAQPDVLEAYTGLSHVAREDVDLFWDGIERSDTTKGEKQVTGGLQSLLDFRKLHYREIDWTDVGDEHAYRMAVAKHDGYDWTKLNQATYVLPEEGRVVKFNDDQLVIRRRVLRHNVLKDTTPDLIDSNGQLIAMKYIPGSSGYDVAREWPPGKTMGDVLAWGEDKLWARVTAWDADHVCMRFYRDKTEERLRMLNPELRVTACDAVNNIPWHDLCKGPEVSRIHGDLNFGNIVHDGEEWFGIDWREDFGGEGKWGDKRWDLAKLLAGTVVHWDRARLGSFRPWPEGQAEANVLREYTGKNPAVEIIGALSLLNSAPLHAPPLDEILVARGTSWLAQVL